MRGIRDWPAWLVGWTLSVEASLWAWVAHDVLRERGEPTLSANPVADGVPTAALVLAVAVPLCTLLVLVARTRRVGLAAGGIALLGAAWTWSRMGDVGGWYAGLSVAAGLLGLVAGALGRRPDDGDGRAPGRVATASAGLVLATAGLVLSWTCWQGGAYWQWMGSQRWTYGAGVAAGIVLALAGATASRWPTAGPPVVRVVVATVLALLGAGLLVTGHGIFQLEGGVLYRFEENESPWGFGTPAVLAGTGLVAAAVAALRRRGDLLALSAGAAVGVGLLALWHDATWGRLMR
ncbi:hypothetical protein KDN32_12415 [Nocardioides sp. J2M5]|uniref:hypothetical protein n=1 Tax=Nocardioides palaemonis TaxID=2829810 RepID=UPI001BAE09FF|nr:hypothetical protein [Nocardioides palaemonis]MBS2938545.1 hypothetical protein [Nocardioides palaemonis]